MNWREYQAKILPLLKIYREDELPESIKSIDDFYEYVESLLKDKEAVHEVVLDLIDEKPIKEDLDSLLEEGIKHEYDQLIETISNSDSFEEANKLANELWD
jgi:hypothetical protein